MVSEQRERLLANHRLEMTQLQTELSELRNQNSKIISNHQQELMELEQKLRQESKAQTTRRMEELQATEQRARDELAHAMEIHRKNIEEMKKQVILFFLLLFFSLDL